MSTAQVLQHLRYLRFEGFAPEGGSGRIDGCVEKRFSMLESDTSTRDAKGNTKAGKQATFQVLAYARDHERDWVVLDVRDDGLTPAVVRKQLEADPQWKKTSIHAVLLANSCVRVADSLNRIRVWTPNMLVLSCAEPMFSKARMSHAPRGEGYRMAPSAPFMNAILGGAGAVGVTLQSEIKVLFMMGDDAQKGALPLGSFPRAQDPARREVPRAQDPVPELPGWLAEAQSDALKLGAIGEVNVEGAVKRRACPKCGDPKGRLAMVQLGCGDEPPVAMISCSACGGKSRA